MSWMAGIGAGLSSLGGSMQAREAEKRAREDRLKDIRDKLSLVNAQAPEKKRVIPGQELPADVAGPPAPEMVETFQTKLTYDPENGYVPEDKVLRSERNQWSTTDMGVDEAGGKVITKTTEEDLTGRKRSNFDTQVAQPKLTKQTITRGDKKLDVLMDPSGEIVKVLGEGDRYRPASAGQSEADRRAYVDYQHEKILERQRKAAELAAASDAAGFTGNLMQEWREMKPDKRAAYNEDLGLKPDAREQDVRNAIRMRYNADRSAEGLEVPKPTPAPDQARKDTEALLSNLPQDRQAKAAVEPEIGVNPDAAELMRRAQKAKGNDAEKSELWKNRDKAPVPESESPFKRPREADNPKVVKEKPNAAEKPKAEEKPKDDTGPKFKDPEMKKNFDEDLEEFERIMEIASPEQREEIKAKFQDQMKRVYNISFK